MPPFEFISESEFERLSSPARFAYLSAAIEELQRANVPPKVRCWHSLFTQAEHIQVADLGDHGEIPHWRFICADDRTWSWRYADIVSDPLPSIEAATADATVIVGFDPVSEYWTVTMDGATTRHYPGKAPLDLPSGERPSSE